MRERDKEKAKERERVRQQNTTQLLVYLEPTIMEWGVLDTENLSIMCLHLKHNIHEL